MLYNDNAYVGVRTRITLERGGGDVKRIQKRPH